ncbi:uncharacterized protein DS421_13g418690 [Arachis hypogaea]|nr:uncharacterized protein DS421_13g418690 [Arachis hypogaea]
MKNKFNENLGCKAIRTGQREGGLPRFPQFEQGKIGLATELGQGLELCVSERRRASWNGVARWRLGLPARWRWLTRLKQGEGKNGGSGGWWLVRRW